MSARKQEGDDFNEHERLRLLEERLTKLEQRLKQLEQQLRTRSAESSAEQPSSAKSEQTRKKTSHRPAEAAGTPSEQASLGSADETGNKEQERPSIFDRFSTSEGAQQSRWNRQSEDDSFLEGSSWLNKLGAVLLIVGLLLLFKYSIEQGWITPAVRLGVGALLSSGLMGWGLLTGSDRTRFRQTVLGGGLAGFYITGFAAYYLYGYLSVGASWVYMLGVAAVALYLALREDEQVLAVLGLVGGFATPFLLYRDAGQYIDLILYTCLLLGVSGLLYVYRRWVSLLWVMFFGGIGVFGVTLAYGILGVETVPQIRRWGLQAALLFYLSLLWAVPMRRSWQSLDNPDRWGTVNRASVRIHQPLLVLVLPLVVLLFSIWTWSWSVLQSGMIGLGTTVVLGGLYLLLDRSYGRNLKQVHLYSAFLVLGFSLWMLFAGDYLYAWLAVQMLLMHAAGYMTQDDRLATATHLVGLGVGLHFLDRLWEVNSWAVTGDNLAEFITLLSFAGSSYMLSSRDREPTIYGLFALITSLAWLANLFGGLAGGQMYVTISWGVVALLTLGVGYRFPLRIARYSGAGVLLLTLAKLVFYDLAHLDTIWRILLFLGFGLVLLITGYLLSSRE